MKCPRCEIELNPQQVRPKGAERAVHVDWCGRCSGVWLDAGEAAVVSPTFANLDRRRIEIEALGRAGGGIAGCPRCGKTPHACFVMDLEIDYCLGCGGTWLDQAESEGRLLRHAGADLGARGPYRAAQLAARTDATPCAYCSNTERVKDMFMSGRGLVCRRCHNQILVAEQNIRIEQEREEITRGSVVLEVVAGLLDALVASDGQN